MKKFCKQHIGIFVVGLFVCALISNLITGFLQNMFAGNIVQYYWIEAVCKCVISILPLALMVKWGYVGKSNAKKSWKRNSLFGFIYWRINYSRN